MSNPQNSSLMISILMPVFNAEKFVEQAINSILDQSHTNWELLIYNDGSTDISSDIISHFSDPRIKVWNNEKNIGYLDSCNKLFKKTTGHFITFLDADDTCPKDRLSICLREFEIKPELDFLTTDHVRCNVSGTVVSENHVEVDYLKYSTTPNYYATICCATIFLRKELLSKVGGYHPFFKAIGGEDYHWLFRLSRVGKGHHLKELLYNYRKHGDQLHEKNQHSLKFFAQDIDREIRRELATNKTDLLSDSKNLWRKWERHVQQHPEQLLFKQSAWELNSGDKKKSIGYAFSALKAAPISITSWQRFLHLIYSIARR